MKVTFYGAAQMVTGSKHLVEVNGKRILLDCGLFQGGEKDLETLNSKFPFDPSSIDVILLSHAHIDHSGLIPLVVKQGFSGNIYCTYATRDLANIMLEDSAAIQEHDAEYLNKKNKKHHMKEPLVEPLYTREDAEACMKQFHGVNYNTEINITDDIVVMFRDAGHILGSSTVEIHDMKTNEKIVFTGDLGRKGLPILKDPTPVEEATYLISESTYGNRSHDDVSHMEADIEKVINDTYKKGGRVVIPAFSIGRTQEMIYLLHLLWDAKRIPEMPIFVDSPLAKNATEVFKAHPETYDKDMFENFLMNQHNPFSFGKLHYTQDVEESKRLNELQEPCIIISSAGMCTAGRILHHLKRALPEDKNTILIIGYMAQGTLGRRLVEKESEVMIHGQMRQVHADIVVLNSFSAHADKDELFEFTKHIKGLKRVFLIHGEPDQMKPHAERLKKEGVVEQVCMPHPGDSYDL